MNKNQSQSNYIYLDTEDFYKSKSKSKNYEVVRKGVCHGKFDITVIKSNEDIKIDCYKSTRKDCDLFEMHKKLKQK